MGAGTITAQKSNNMELAVVLMCLIVVVVIGLVVLALIGLKERKKEREYLEKYNQDSIKSFMQGQKNKKYKRQSTPRVPKINK